MLTPKADHVPSIKKSSVDKSNLESLIPNSFQDTPELESFDVFLLNTSF